MAKGVTWEIKNSTVTYRCECGCKQTLDEMGSHLTCVSCGKSLAGGLF